MSSLFSLIIGSVLGLTQSRIKRLFAYSTISHVGFILLALSINSAESIQSYIFYILQYSLSNLNAFIILISMEFVLHFYVDREKVYNNFIDLYNKYLTKGAEIKPVPSPSLGSAGAAETYDINTAKSYIDHLYLRHSLRASNFKKFE